MDSTLKNLQFLQDIVNFDFSIEQIKESAAAATAATPIAATPIATATVSRNPDSLTVREAEESQLFSATNDAGDAERRTEKRSAEYTRLPQVKRRMYAAAPSENLTGLMEELNAFEEDSMDSIQCLAKCTQVLLKQAMEKENSGIHRSYDVPPLPEGEPKLIDASSILIN